MNLFPVGINHLIILSVSCPRRKSIWGCWFHSFYIHSLRWVINWPVWGQLSPFTPLPCHLCAFTSPNQYQLVPPWLCLTPIITFRLSLASIQFLYIWVSSWIFTFICNVCKWLCPVWDKYIYFLFYFLMSQLLHCYTVYKLREFAWAALMPELYQEIAEEWVFCLLFPVWALPLLFSTHRYSSLLSPMSSAG